MSVSTYAQGTPWPDTTVGAQFEIQLGKMLDAARNSGELKPYLGNRAVQWCRIDLSAVSTVPLSRAEMGRYRLKRGDLLVCEGGEVGRAAIWTDQLPECYYQKALHRLRPQRGYDPRIMLALLEYWSSRNDFANFVTQTSFAHLPRDKFQMMPLPLIPLDEQERIAEVLDDFDGQVATLARLIAKKEAIRQGMMQQLLKGRTRLPGFSTPWETRRLGELLAYEQPGPYLVSSADYVDTGTPVLTAGKTFRLGYTSDRHGIYAAVPVIIFDDFTTASKYVDFPFKAKSSAMKMLSARTGVSLRYMYARMKLIDLVIVDHKRRWIAEYSKLELDTPRTDEQEAIASVIDNADEEIAELQHRLAKARAVKQGMMQELLTGRTRLLAEVAS